MEATRVGSGTAPVDAAGRGVLVALPVHQTQRGIASARVLSLARSSFPLPWTLFTNVTWSRGKVTLALALDSRKRVRPEDLRLLKSSGFLDRTARELAGRGLKSGVKESLQEVWKGEPSPLTIFFERDRIPPGRLVEAVDGLRDWIPTVEKSRGS